MQFVVVGLASLLIVLLAGAALLLLRQAHRVFDALCRDERPPTGGVVESAAGEPQGTGPP